MSTSSRPRTTYVGTVQGHGGHFGLASGQPFYEVRLALSAGSQASALLKQSADPVARRWITIVATGENPDRLRVTHSAPPAYELSAADSYLRGDVLRVTGNPGKSVNLDLSSRFGVPTVCALLDAAIERAREFIVLRVPARRHDLIEVVADTDLPAHPTDEDARLGAAGAAAAALALAPEDFADWEEPSDA